MPVIVPRTRASAIATALVIALACRGDGVTAPHAVNPGAPLAAAATNAPGDSSAPEVVFLAPLGPRRVPRGILDTTAVPTLAICRLDGPRCSADTVARFTSDSTTGATGMIRRTQNAFVAGWHTAALSADSTIVYRAIVSLGDTTAGWTDFRLVARLPARAPGPRVNGAITDSIGGDSVVSDSAGVMPVRMRSRIRIRFRIFQPPRRLTVSVRAGVSGSLPDGVQRVRAGERVAYGFVADAGYDNVLVTLDGAYVPASGHVRMDRDRLLVVTADRSIAVDARDAPLVRQVRRLLHTNDRVAAAQRLLDTLAALTDTAALLDRLDRVALAAADPVTDSAALRALDDALAGHVFRVGEGAGVAPTPAPDSGGGGGGGVILFNRLTPKVRLTATPAALDAPWIGGDADVEEPVMIGYVNGILTDPVRALMTANYVLRATVKAPWRVAAPFRVKLIYNRSGIAGAPPEGVVARCAAAAAARSGWLGLNTVPRFLARCAGGVGGALTRPLADLVEAAFQYGSIGVGAPPALADARRVADSVTAWRDLGAHVLLVAHSQGNMMVQEGVRMLAADGRYRPAADSTCLAAVSLAAPTSRNWPISARHLTGFAVRGDAILALHGNDFERLDTPMSDELDRMVAAERALGNEPGALSARLLVGMQLHDVIGSYLRQPAALLAVQRGIVHGYGSCALGAVEVNPGAVVLHPGEERTLGAALRDVNGDALDGVRALHWAGESASDWQRSVQVSPTGTVHASYVGGTSVAAGARTRTGRAGVTVEPLPLALTTQEQLSYYWSTLGPAWAGASGGPGPMVPGGAWNGGACSGRVVYGETLYGQLCVTDYRISLAPVPGAARYQGSIFMLGDVSHPGPLASTTPPLRYAGSGPHPAGSNGPPPPLMDRVTVQALDASGHLLGTGAACMHGCVGWPSP